MNFSPLKHRFFVTDSPQPGSYQAGFTMIEIAICLAIIGIALVAIIGVLPFGMHTQRENREETIINQDASVLLEAIRNGSGQNDLTNYVFAITNYCVYFPKNSPSQNEYSGVLTGFTNGAQIVGMLSTPQYVDINFFPTNNLFSGGYSNHIVAYVRSMSGYAVEKPPQDNEILVGDALAYRLYCVNAPVADDTNNYANPTYYDQQVAANLHELRLRFLYPILPSGNVGRYFLNFRTLVSGRIATVTNQFPYLYFYQPQNYTNAP